MTLPERRKRALDRKLLSLSNDLITWKTVTENAPMHRHYSQVRRMDRILTGLLESMQTSEGWKNPDEATILSKASYWERRILTAYSIWEVFRSKWAMRQDPIVSPGLMACDDLAWACYKPAMDRYMAGKPPKEPPLVYLGSTWSPFLRARDRAFTDEIETGYDAREALVSADYLATLQKLPIPLMGLPWFQVADMPSALLIAHETGHAVEFDFQLTGKISEALLAADLDFFGEWDRCASEVFADLYGCLSCGPCFANSLLDLLVTDKKAVENEQYFAGGYPTRAFRVELAAAALNDLGFTEEAAAVLKTWAGVYPGGPKPAAFLDDVPKVVQAIYGPAGMNLKTLMAPTSMAEVIKVGKAAVLNNANQLVLDPRTLFSAARWVHDNLPDQVDVAQSVLTGHLLTASPIVYRNRGSGLATDKEFKNADRLLSESKTADEEALNALLKSLGLDEEA